MNNNPFMIYMLGMAAFLQCSLGDAMVTAFSVLIAIPRNLLAVAFAGLRDEATEEELARWAIYENILKSLEEMIISEEEMSRIMQAEGIDIGIHITISEQEDKSALN